jgi:hypothetical protein
VLILRVQFGAFQPRKPGNKVSSSQDDDFIDTEGSRTSNYRWSMGICTSDRFGILRGARHKLLHDMAFVARSRGTSAVLILRVPFGAFQARKPGNKASSSQDDDFVDTEGSRRQQNCHPDRSVPGGERSGGTTCSASCDRL